MSLGSPISGTATAWYSQFETDVQNLLQRLQDNSSQAINAKDVRDAVWTLHNQIQTIGSQSVTQSGIYTTSTQSTVTVGGLLVSQNYSGNTYNDMFEVMLNPYNSPVINYLLPNASLDEVTYQFGQSTPAIDLHYSIVPGSSPIFTINFEGPYLPVAPNIPTGFSPDIGISSPIVPTYSITPSIMEYNTFTMSFITTDTLTFSATASIVYKHKHYYGPLVIPGGFTASDVGSVALVGSYITDTVIKSLTFSQIAVDHSLERRMYFQPGAYFVYAAPVLFDDLIGDGFIINGMPSNAFTKVRISSTFSNEYSYEHMYDVWVSNAALGESIINVVHQ